MESRHRKPEQQRKDRLIQTRVGRELESTLKEEATRRRLSVSHLIRNLLEDSFNLVDNIVENVDDLVQDSIGLAEQLKRDAQRIGARAKEAASGAGKSAPPDAPDAPEAGPAQANDGQPAEGGQAAEDGEICPDLSDVLAWNEVTLNRAANCAGCQTSLARGTTAHMGIGGKGDGPPPWLCDTCLGNLE